MNVLLVEDHPIFRFGVAQLIRNAWPDAVVSEAGSLAEALTAVQAEVYAVALVDLNLPDSEGLEVLARLRRAAPAMPVLILSFNAEAAYARHALELGAAGYLNKERAGDELIKAIEKVAAGGRYITASLAEQLADQLTQPAAAGHAGLSPQETRVMILLAEGRRIADIADTMALSPKTVSTYRNRILEKLGLDSNADLVRYCLARQLIAPGH